MSTTKAAHTPGPWEVRRGAADQVFAKSGCRICTVMPKHDEPYRDFEEDAANAQLIAGAPELLNVVCRLATYCEQHSVPELQGIACEAFAAIAKAKGQS